MAEKQKLDELRRLNNFKMIRDDDEMLGQESDGEGSDKEAMPDKM